MTGLSLLKHACRVWPHHELATRAQINHLRHEYVRKVQQLGDRYLIAKANYIQKREAA